jgi:LAS seventeen-binding protein 5
MENSLTSRRKYGNMHRQRRALTILDALISNAGPRFQRTFADEPLLERLRLMPRDDLVDSDVRAKCNTLYRQWAQTYKSTPGLSQIATLYKQLPQTKRRQPSQSKVIRETEVEAARTSPPISPISRNFPSSSASSSSSKTTSRPVAPGSTGGSSSFFVRSKDKDKKNRGKPFNLEKEKGQLMETIASASVASTNLLNAIKLINRENQRVSENAECRNRFETCKVLRRQILRYIQLVESEQYIGGLLSANDELVKALMAYEVMDKSIEDDSDSDVEAYQASKARFERRLSDGRDAEQAMASMSLNAVSTSPPPTKPPRPSPPAPVPAPKPTEPESEEEDDEDNPFADRNAVKTPAVERRGMAW